MNKVTPMVLAALLVASGSSWARCKEGQIKQCTVKGKKATMECVSGRWTKCGADAAMPAAPKAPQAAASAAAK